MRKLTRTLAMFMAVCMALTMTAFASGEASDETVMSVNASAEPGVVMFTIDENGLTREEAKGVTLKGEVTAAGADGIEMDITSFTTTGFKVTGGEFTIKNSVLTKAPGAVVGANDAGGAIAAVTAGRLVIDNCTITAAGKGGRNGNYAVDCEASGEMVVINSNIIQTGFAGDENGFTEAIADPPSNLGLLISGYARANMSVGKSQTYYYGSYVETEGWAAMSTDSAQSDFKFFSYDSVGKAVHGGYGTYADTSCVDWFYASDLISPEVGAIISNNGEIHMRSGADADGEVLAYLPADYQVTERYGDGRSTVQAGRNDFQLHSPDMGGGGARGDFVAVIDLADTDLITSAELDKEATLIDWSKDYGPAVAEYIDMVKGANILVKSTCADITLKNVTNESSSGVLLMTALNSDSMSRYAKASDDMADHTVAMTITDSALAGDVLHYDYQRNTAVTLDNASWDGAYVTQDKAGWDAMWSDACKAHDYCYWILDTEKYFDGQGTWSAMTVGAGSVWNVTGMSNITSLTVEKSGTVNGTVTVDGKAVDVSAGGSWNGDIVITPAADASGDASGEATAELASEVVLTDVDIMGAFTLAAVQVNFEDRGNGVKAFTISFEGHVIPGTITMGTWAPDSGDTNEQGICSGVQAAYEAMTGAGGK